MMFVFFNLVLSCTAAVPTNMEVQRGPPSLEAISLVQFQAFFLSVDEGGFRCRAAALVYSLFDTLRLRNHVVCLWRFFFTR